jgi:hypothetical protein
LVGSTNGSTKEETEIQDAWMNQAKRIKNVGKRE